MKKTLCLLVMLLTSFAVANTTMAQSTLTIKNGQFNTKKLPSAPYYVVTAHGFEKIPYIWKGSDVNLSVLDFINSIN